MIINWLLYSILVGGILAIAGNAFEYGARALRLPTRWVWIAVMVLSTICSALTLAKGLVRHPSTEPAMAYAVPAFGSTPNAEAAPMRVWNAQESARVRSWNRPKPTQLQPVIESVLNSTGGLPAAIGVDERSFRVFDTPLLITCGALALLGMVTLAVTLARLSGVAYALDHAVVEGVPVLLSRNIGPALLGVTRFHVVLPRWVTEMPSADVRTILAHEQEHALAGDPTLTLGALVMAALQPWNPALWFALARLRLATEADCDARVLGLDGDVRRYGHLLVNVYQRAQSGLSPLTSFVTRTSQLEARIRRMVSRAPKSFSPTTIGAFAAAVMLCTLAYGLEVTAQRSHVFGWPPMDSAVAMVPAAPQARPKPREQADATPRANADSTKPALKVVRTGSEDEELTKIMNRLNAWNPAQQKTKAGSATTPARKAMPDTALSVPKGIRKYYDIRQTDPTPLRYSDSAMTAGLRAIATDSAKAERQRINVKLDAIKQRPDTVRVAPVKGRGAAAPAGRVSSPGRSTNPVFYAPRRMAGLADSARRITVPDSTR